MQEQDTQENDEERLSEEAGDSEKDENAAQRTHMSEAQKSRGKEGYSLCLCCYSR